MDAEEKSKVKVQNAKGRFGTQHSQFGIRRSTLLPVFIGVYQWLSLQSKFGIRNSEFVLL